MTIEFNRSGIVGEEVTNVVRALANSILAGNGPFGKQCEARLEQEMKVCRVLLTTSCTHALEMAGLLLDVKSGDEVIVSSYTFVSTANAFVLRGARPVLADIRPDTLNLDERLLDGLITPRTRAVVPVHYAGVSCEMDAILTVARQHGVAVVEDNAHGLFGRYRGQSLGTFGCLATQSFHETKNVTCGEGGALVINDPQYIERAEVIREKGTDRSKFLRGLVDKYTWVDIGSSYVMSDLLAAVLLAQLERADWIQECRKWIWDRYAAGLTEWANQNGVRLPFVPAHCEQTYHMFYLLMPSEKARDGLITFLRQRGIHAVFHYLPLHLSPMGRRFGGREGDCPVTEDVSRRLVRLPFFTTMTAGEQETVVEAVKGFRP